MLVTIHYRKNGFLFATEYKRRPISFPLRELDRAMVRDSGWETVNALEQIWQQGLLEAGPDGYLLPPEHYYALEAELREALPVPETRAQLCIEENGNVASASYSISWYLRQSGRNAGRSVRLGCIARAGGRDWLLTREQYLLIRRLEDWHDDGSPEARARFQAECKLLAQKANAQLSRYSESRAFFFADRVKIAVKGDGQNGIRIVPEFPDVPDAVAAALPKHLSLINQVRADGKNVRLFASEEAVQLYNQIMQIPGIEGNGIPAFLRNPLAILPKNLPIDADALARSIRKLKVRTARIMPYAAVEKTGNGNEWVRVTFGSRLIEDSMDVGGEPLTDSEALQEQLRRTAEAGGTDLYHEGVWFHIDPKRIMAHRELEKRVAEATDGEPRALSRRRLSRILSQCRDPEGIEYGESVRGLLRGEEPAAYAVPGSFCGRLLPRQLPGCQFLRSRYEMGTGALLEADAGPDKAVWILTLLAHLVDRSSLAPALIVVPGAGAMDDWISRIRQMLPSVRRIGVHHGANRCTGPEELQGREIVLTTYETLVRDHGLLAGVRWSAVICDDTQSVRNFDTFAAGAVRDLHADMRIAVTGAPTEKRLRELWAIADFIRPGLLGSYRDFQGQYEAPILRHGPDREARVQGLLEKLSPIHFRGRRPGEITELRQARYETTESQFTLNLAQFQVERYRALAGELRGCGDGAADTIRKLEMLCSHPRLIARQTDPVSAAELKRQSPKLVWTLLQLEKIRKKKEKAVIFTGYIGMQAMLRQAIFEEFRINAQIVSGVPNGAAVQLIHRFSQSPGFDVMILSPQAAGAALNITAANHVIHYSPAWDPAVEDRASGRICRPEQTKPVFIYHPVMVGDGFETIEQRLAVLQGDMRKLMGSAIIPDSPRIRTEDLRSLF